MGENVAEPQNGNETPSGT